MTRTASSTLSNALLPALERRPRIGVVVLAALILAAYANSLSGVLLFDDHRVLAHSRSVPPLSTLLTQSGRPLLNLTLALNYAVHGAEPAGYHIVNVFIHLAAALVLFDLVRLLLRGQGDCEGESPFAQDATLLALVTASLWALHPVQTESVTYIVQRGESLMGLFYLATLTGLVRGALSTKPLARAIWFTAAVLSCALGMKTKEVMVTAPLAALLVDRVYLASSWRDVLRRWPVHVGLFATWGLLAGSASQAVSSETVSAGFGMGAVSPLDYLLSQAGVVLYYLRLAIIPYPLCLDHDWPLVRTWSGALPALLGVAALLAASVVLFLRAPKLGLLAVLFFLILAPTSSVMPIADIAVERRLYLPLAPLLLLIVLTGRLALQRAMGRGGVQAVKIAGAATAAAIVSMLVLTVCRNIDYQTEVGMWQSVIEISPANARAWNNLANALERTGRTDLAETAYRKSLEIGPLPEARANYGTFLIHSDRVDEAVALLRQAVKAEPGFARAWSTLAVALSRAGQTDEAIAACREAIRLNPASSGAHMTLAALCERTNDVREAEQHYREARAIGDDPQASRRLGRMLVKIGRSAEAVPLLEEAVRKTPADALLVSDLAFACAESGDSRRARECFARARQLDPVWPRKVASAAWLMATDSRANTRDGVRAVVLARQALSGDPADPSVLDALAAAQAEIGNFTEATAAARLAAVHFAQRGDRPAEAAVQARLKLYESSQPYRGERGY